LKLVAVKVRVKVQVLSSVFYLAPIFIVLNHSFLFLKITKRYSVIGLETGVKYSVNKRTWKKIGGALSTKKHQQFRSPKNKKVQSGDFQKIDSEEQVESAEEGNDDEVHFVTVRFLSFLLLSV